VVCVESVGLANSVRSSEVKWYIKMTERRNTLVCTFDPASPRITAYDVHEWIYDTVRLPDSDVLMIQVDGIRRQVQGLFK